MKLRNEKFKDLIFYEIYPTSFYDSNGDGIGDLKGIEEKLPYIKQLGCNAIWINPFFKSPFHDGGYDVTDFYDVDPKFGSMQDFEHLVKVADENGIKIIIDCVAGHSSEEHPLFLKSAEWARNEYSDLFIWNDCVWHYDHDYILINGRYPRDGSYMVNFFSIQPAFNYGFNVIKNDKWQMSYKDKRTFQARDYIIDVMKFWLSKGAYGFRVDMADSLVKNDDDKSATIEVWHYIFNEVRKDYPDAFYVSEWSNPEKSFKAGFDCDFVLEHWNNFYHRLVRSTKEFSEGDSILNGGEIDYFIKDLQERYNHSIEQGGYLGIISGNHDTIRIANYLDIERLRMWYMFMFMLPGIPFVYYGDEIGMKHCNIPNKDGGYHRTGTRTPMQWDLTKNDGFSTNDDIYLPVNVANRNNVEEELKNPDSIYYTIKKMIELRKSISDITAKEMSFDVTNRIITLNRGKFTLILNCSDSPFEFKGKVIYRSSKSKENLVQVNEGIIIER